MYLWAKSFHIITMVAWFAGLFYLPRLYVYHTEVTDKEGTERFKIMERRLYYGIMLPALVLTLGSGIYLLWLKGWSWLTNTPWIQIKIALVASLIIFHWYLGYLRTKFADDLNRHSAFYFKVINEIPVFVLISAVLLAVLKP